MKLRKLQDEVWGKFQHDAGVNDSGAVDDIVLATILGMGFHINAAGDICDPRPAPPSTPPSTGIHYRGQRPRVRRRK